MLAEFRQWLEATEPTVLPKSPEGDSSQRPEKPRGTMLEPRYNIALTQTVAATQLLDGKLQLMFLRRGLVLSWAKDCPSATR